MSKLTNVTTAFLYWRMAGRIVNDKLSQAQAREIERKAALVKQWTDNKKDDGKRSGNT
jgi:uncharacterized protein YecE (DUF72 family)